MNRRCALAWVAVALSVIIAITAFSRGGSSGLDGLFVVIALAWVMLAILSHRTTFHRG